MENKKVLLSVKDLHVKFRVRGRILTAIRGISMDFYENESVAIVGESGSGKSVFTKTFAGMLETNGFISEGSIIFNDEELADTVVALNSSALSTIARDTAKLNEYSKLELGADIHRQILELESEKKARETMSEEDDEASKKEIDDLIFKKTELFNMRQTIDTSKEKARYKAVGEEIKELEKQITALQKQKAAIIAEHKKAMKQDTAYLTAYNQKMNELKAAYAKKIQGTVSEEAKARNEIIAKEIYLSIGRYDSRKRAQLNK